MDWCISVPYTLKWKIFSSSKNQYSPLFGDNVALLSMHAQYRRALNVCLRGEDKWEFSPLFDPVEPKFSGSILSSFFFPFSFPFSRFVEIGFKIQNFPLHSSSVGSACYTYDVPIVRKTQNSIVVKSMNFGTRLSKFQPSHLVALWPWI